MSKQYVCPYCDHIFVAGSFKDLLAKKNENGTLLKCPKCGKENYCRELR